MLTAKEIRKYAREALAGRWLKAGGVGLAAGFLGASIAGGSVSSGSAGGSSSAESEWANIFSTDFSASSEVSAILVAVILGVVLVAAVWAIAALVIGGATTLGYAKYNLNLVDDNEPKFANLFSQYNRLGAGFVMQFLRALFMALWSLLFVIPGIIARYRYYMTPFILCENPEMSAKEAIDESKELMKGNKWRLFCLEVSFYGWYILSAVVLCVVMLVGSVPMFIVGNGAADGIVIGAVIMIIVITIAYSIVMNLILGPYVTAAVAVFYREISQAKYSDPHVESEVVDYVYETVPENENIEYIEL